MTDIIINIRVRAGTPLHRAMYAAVADERYTLARNGVVVPGLAEVEQQLSPAAVTQRKRHRAALHRDRSARWRASKREQEAAHVALSRQG